ncbi:alkaline phosphatase family protein [Halomarina salina]|uniref:Alkaline phosphatase family protein n=1 Tax=Halomarina salina TaxID=1872699 RepID=A0ABD5RTR4_9EURY|nr:alkaline phosphatase family protein [Halomarina salina]
MTEYEPGDGETLLIGIDAGSFAIFDRLIEEGHAPNMEALCTGGVAGSLESQVPPWTPSAWPSMYTGTNPGKHGAFGFTGYDGYDWHIVGADHVQEHALWELLDERGLTSVVVNVPMTHPPGDIDGAILPGFMAPEDPNCHPKGLLADVRAAIGDYRVYRSYDVESDDEELTEAEKLVDYRECIRMRGEAYRYLADRFDPDFGFVEFQHTDKLFHEFGGDDWEQVRTVYEALDEQVGALLNARDPERVFIASDHGIGRYDGWQVHVNDILRELGYVETTTDSTAMPSWSPIRDTLREGTTDATDGGSVDGNGDGGNGGEEAVDFAESVAYMRHRSELGVRINREGRDPAGVVPDGEFEAIREEIIAELTDLRAPDGRPVFEDVAPVETYFEGSETDRAVDIITVPRAFDNLLHTELAGEAFTVADNLWNHKRDGMIVAVGNSIDSSESLADAHLFDIAPSVLAALDVPYSDRMDGKVLPVIKNDGEAVAYPEYEGVRPHDSAADNAVKQRLSDLGYLE